MASNRSILYIGAGITALVVLVVAVVLVSGDRRPQQFPPDSPRGVVQRYLAAWDRRDYGAAYLLFSSRAKADVLESDYRAAANDYASYGPPGNGTARSVFIDDVTQDGAHATVWLTVEELSGQGLNASTYRYTRTVPLVPEDAGWRIDEALLWLDPGPFPAPMK